jgi:signal transduction histidine kinase
MTMDGSGDRSARSIDGGAEGEANAHSASLHRGTCEGLMDPDGTQPDWGEANDVHFGASVPIPVIGDAGAVGGATDRNDASDAKDAPEARGGAVSVKGLMDRSIVGVRQDLSVDEIGSVVLREGLSGLPVVDGEGRLVGVVSADMMRSSRGPQLRDVMWPDMSALLESWTVVRAAGVMAMRNRQWLPVISPDCRVVGMVTALDLLRQMLPAHGQPSGARTSGHPAPGGTGIELAGAPMSLLSINDEGMITMVENPQPLTYGSVHWSDPDQLVGRSVLEEFADVPGFADSCRRGLAGDAHTGVFDPRDGKRTWEAHFTPLHDSLGRLEGMIVLVIDVTEGRPAETSLESTEQRSVAADWLPALGSLAGGIADQINNALTYMRLSTGRLISLEQSLRPVTPLRQHRLDMLHDVRTGIVQIERINSELAHFSQMDRSTAGPVDLPALIESVISVAGHEIHHRARLLCEYGPVPRVNGSEAALRQVLLNLIVNAAQAIPDGEAHHNDLRIATCTDAAGRAVVEVSDTGAGIAPHLMEKIFEPLFTTRASGTAIGLGLSVCPALVKALGGEITAESVEGQGTTMRVMLPPARPAEAARAVARTLPLAAIPASDRSPGRVMVVDDEPTVARIVALELDLEGLDVVVASSGREALEVLRVDRTFDVVLCDVMMPEISGVDLYRAVAAMDPDVAARFVFMSGGVFNERAASFLREVPNPRLHKPFTARDLLACVAGALAPIGEAVDRRGPPPPLERTEIEIVPG